MDDETAATAGPDRTVRVPGRFGELVLRIRDGHAEILSNGVMLVDTRDGRSERLLVRRALAAVPAARHVLIGGLGVGFSLAEALAARVPAVTVVECEPAVVAWNREVTGAMTGGSVDHPTVDCVTADVVAWLRGTDARFDAICLDVDNGPGWTVGAGNRVLYSRTGLLELRRHLAPGGALAVWSADRSPAFERRLAAVFERVEIDLVEVARGVPDVVYVGSGELSGRRGRRR